MATRYKVCFFATFESPHFSFSSLFSHEFDVKRFFHICFKKMDTNALYRKKNAWRSGLWGLRRYVISECLSSSTWPTFGPAWSACTVDRSAAMQRHASARALATLVCRSITEGGGSGRRRSSHNAHADARPPQVPQENEVCRTERDARAAVTVNSGFSGRVGVFSSFLHITRYSILNPQLPPSPPTPTNFSTASVHCTNTLPAVLVLICGGLLRARAAAREQHVLPRHSLLYLHLHRRPPVLDASLRHHFRYVSLSSSPLRRLRLWHWHDVCTMTMF